MSQHNRPRLAVTAACLVIATITMTPVVAGAPGAVASTPSDAIARTSAGGVDDATECRTKIDGVSDEISEPRVVPTTLKIERVEGTERIRFAYTFDLPDDTTQFDIEYLYPDEGYPVVETNGFDDDQELAWDGTTATPTLTIEHTLQNDTNDSIRYVKVPDIGGFIQRDDPPDGHADAVYSDRVGFWLNTSVQTCIEGDYVPALGELLRGSYTTYTETADEKQITLFVPDGANMSVSPDEVITALAATERTIQEDPHEDVYLFVVESQVRAGGASGRTARVAAGAPLEVYIHEFAHVNEEGVYSRDMAWFTEASAEYYGSTFEPANGRLRIRYAKMLKRTHPNHGWSQRAHDDEVLAEMGTWDRWTDYEKGSRLLFALDAKLRASTDGEATIHDLMRGINTYAKGPGGRVTYDVFKQIVAGLAGEETATWLDPYVLTAQAVPQPNSSAFGPTPDFTEETTNSSGGASETFELGITMPSGEQRGLESVTLSIEAPERTVKAAVSDGNDDGRVTVEFQPAGPDGAAVLDTAASADAITLRTGSLEEPLVSNKLQVKLLVPDSSGSYTLATRSITLTSTPTEASQNDPPVKVESDSSGNPVIDGLQNLLPERVLNPSPLDMIIGGSLGFVIVLLLSKWRSPSQ